MAACDTVCWTQRVILTPTTAIGLALNLSALWMLFYKIRRFTETTIYLANLIVNDILLIFSLPFKMYAYSYNWTLGQGFCSFLESLIYVNIYGSIFFIVCIAVDRYIMLRFPFSMTRLRSPRKAAAVCLAIWVVIFGVSPAAYTLHDNGDFCFQNFSNSTWEKVEIVVSMEVVFLASTIIMLFCSINVLFILKDLRKQNPNDEKLRNNKSVKIVVSNLVTFLVSFIPYHTAALVYFLAKRSPQMFHQTTTGYLKKFVHISACLSSINCSLDGLCYYFILQENWVVPSVAASTERTLSPKAL